MDGGNVWGGGRLNRKNMNLVKVRNFGEDVLFEGRFFCIFFWQARMCWPLLCLCRPFCILERCLDSNPESCRSKQARYQLASPVCTYKKIDKMPVGRF